MKKSVFYISIKKKTKDYVLTDLSHFNCQYIKEEALLHNIKVKCFSLEDHKEITDKHNYPIKDFTPSVGSIILKNSSIIVFH